MTIKSMKLSWIVASDMAKTRQFFQTIGLKATADTPEYGWMEFEGSEGGGMILGVGKSNPEEPCGKPGVNAVVTMTVDDIVTSKQELESKGITFIDEIIEVPGHVKMVTFIDPDGNKFQLVQELN